MSKADTWMPLHIGDYLSDTGHLRTVEHGAYLLLLMHYWRSGPLPDDEGRLAAIARMSRREWAEIALTIREFFTASDGRLHQKRADKERAKASALSGKRKAVAEARWGAKSDQTTCNADAIASANADQKHAPDRSRDLNNLPSEDTSSLRSDDPPPRKRSKARSQIPADWEPDEKGIAYANERGVNIDQEVPAFRNRNIAKGELMADWAAAWRTWCDNQVKWGRAPGKADAAATGLFAPAPSPTPPDDPNGILAYMAKHQTRPGTVDGKQVPCINGYGVEQVADEIIRAIHQAGGATVLKPNWHPLAEWLRDDLPADWSRFLGTIKRVASSIGGPIRSMQLFDQALRSERVAA